MTVLEKMAKYDVHRLIAVDADEKVIGLVSLSDIFRFLVLEPPQTAEPRGMYSICMRYKQNF